jgi:hypothetical protein
MNSNATILPTNVNDADLDAVLNAMLIEGGADVDLTASNAPAVPQSYEVENAIARAAARATRTTQLTKEVEEKEVASPVPPGAAPVDLWTLDSMRARAKLTGDIDGTGKRTFTFNPLMDDTYCKERFKRGEDFDNKKEGVTFYEVQLGYAEIVWHCLRGCSWGVLETVEDEYGHTVYEADGVTPKTVALPLTFDSIKRMTFEQLVMFIEAMSKATRGEVNGQV